jgi:hypothetical protein
MEGSRNGLGWQLCSPDVELALAGTDRFDLDSVSLSVFSIEALDKVLCLASFSPNREDALLKRFLSLDNEYHPLLRWIEIRFLSAAGLAILAEHFAFALDSLLHRLIPPPPPSPPPSRWNSAIVADFPKLLEDLKQKQFTLLWRGSRDRFRAYDVHNRCDGHPNTLTVMLSRRGTICATSRRGHLR